MALQTKAFAGSTLTPSGSAAVVGDVLRVTAAASYDLNQAALAALSDGDDIPNWAKVLGSGSVVTFKKQTSGADAVARFIGDGWAGAYKSDANFENGTFLKTIKTSSARMNLCSRFNSTTARGYPVQIVSGTIDHFNSMPTNFVGINTPLRLTQSGITLPSFPFTVKHNTNTQPSGNVNSLIRLNDLVRFDYLDSINKWPAGRIAIQQFVGTTDYTRIAFFPVLTGGFTATFTPESVSTLKRIIVEWDNENSYLKKTSEVFEYSVNGGANWIAVPDDGLINAACVVPPQLRSVNTLKNDYDATGNVNVNSVAVEIDGVWEAPVIPAAPTSLTGIATGPTSIQLNWSNPASADFIFVYKDGDLYSVVEIPTDETLILGLEPETEYEFKLKSVLNGVLSDFSDSILATTEAEAGAPATPTGITATAVGAFQINLEWTDGANTEVMMIFRSLTSDFADASAVGSVVVGEEQFSSLGLNPETQYFYFLIPFNENGSGITSSPVNATTGVAPVNVPLLDSIADHLEDEGIGGGLTGWAIYKSILPASPDKAIAIFETPGETPEIVSEGSSEIKYVNPGIQIRVRGLKFNYEEARLKIMEIFKALHGAEPTTNPGEPEYVYVYAIGSGPLPMGLDTSERPELSWNFRVMREQEEI